MSAQASGSGPGQSGERTRTEADSDQAAGVTAYTASWVVRAAT